MRFSFAYDGPEGAPFDLPPEARVLDAARPDAPDAEACVRDALLDPVAAPPLRVAARGARHVLLLVEDASRGAHTPMLLRHVGAELSAAGVDDASVEVLVAGDTRRPATPEEIATAVGPDALARWRVSQHDWLDGDALARLGATSQGMPVVVNRRLAAADLAIGVGQVDVDALFGFSGGVALAVPGAAGPESAYWAYWNAAQPDVEAALGVLEGPARAAMEEAARMAGLRAALSVATDAAGRVQHASYGEPAEATRRCARAAAALQAAPLDAPADFVLVEAAPADRDLWQATNALAAGALCVAEGGTLVIVAPFAEGVAHAHAELPEYGGLDAAGIAARVARDEARDLTAAAFALVLARAQRRAQVVLATSGIDPRDAAQLRLGHAKTPGDALEAALARHGRDARVAVLRRGGALLPLVGGRNAAALPEGREAFA